MLIEEQRDGPCTISRSRSLLLYPLSSVLCPLCLPSVRSSGADQSTVNAG